MSGGKNTILVVDDDRDLLEALRCLLEEKGWNVAEAKDNAEAKRRIKEIGEKLGLVVTDGILPDGSTWSDFLPFLRARFVGPVIGLSATNPDKLVAAGVDVALQKPIEANEFLRLVSALTA